MKHNWFITNLVRFAEQLSTVTYNLMDLVYDKYPDNGCYGQIKLNNIIYDTMDSIYDNYPKIEHYGDIFCFHAPDFIYVNWIYLSQLTYFLIIVSLFAKFVEPPIFRGSIILPNHPRCQRNANDTPGHATWDYEYWHEYWSSDYSPEDSPLRVSAMEFHDPEILKSETIVQQMVDHYGWEYMRRLDIYDYWRELPLDLIIGDEPYEIVWNWP